MSKLAQDVTSYSDPIGRDKLGNDRAFLAILIFGFVVSLWLRTAFPPHIIGNAGADDTLFIQLARQLVLGNWLGPFSDLTLVKGLGYPAFISLCFLLGLPLKIGESLLYLSISVFIALLTRRITSSMMVGAILFIALCFNPVLWSNDLARIIREGIYVSLSPGLLALVVALVFPDLWKDRTRWIVAASTGAIGAWFILTREEGIWLLPAVVIIVAFGTLAAFRAKGPDQIQRVRMLGRQISLAAICMATLVLMVAGMNRICYGRFQTVEVNSAPFERAYGALSRIEPSQWRRYVVFPIDARRKAYEVSPAAQQLEPFFEGPSGEHWRKIGCDQTLMRDCPEILAGWFQWALRDAVAAAGHYRSAATAAAYYDLLADQINTECDAGRIKCFAERETLAPPFRWHYISDSLARMPQLALLYWRNGLHPEKPQYSVLSPGLVSDPAIEIEAVVKMADFVGGAQPTAQEAVKTRLASRSRSLAMFRITSFLSYIYAPLMVVLITLSIPLTVFLALKTKQSINISLIALVVGCQVAVLSRIILLCYLDATAIPSMNMLYLSPASAMLVISAVVPTLAVTRQILDMSKA